jgi:hypothetical protein
METQKDEVIKLKENYHKLKGELSYCYETEDKDREDFQKFRGVISRFETDVAPKLGIFPDNSKYWTIKTALWADYAGIRTYKEDSLKRRRFIAGLLFGHGYNSDNVIDIIQCINELQKMEGLEEKARDMDKLQGQI